MTTATPGPTRPALVCEKVLERLRQAAAEVLAEFAEPDAVMVVIPWRIGQADFPFGAVVARPGEEGIPPRRAVAFVDQLRKMLSFVAVQLLETPYEATIARLEEALREKEEALQEALQKAGQPRRTTTRRPPPAGDD